MARVKGPNGLVLNLPDAAAKGLVETGRTGDYEYVKDEPKKSEPKSTAKRSSAKK